MDNLQGLGLKEIHTLLSQRASQLQKEASEMVQEAHLLLAGAEDKTKEAKKLTQAVKSFDSTSPPPPPPPSRPSKSRGVYRCVPCSKLAGKDVYKKGHVCKGKIMRQPSQTAAVCDGRGRRDTKLERLLQQIQDHDGPLSRSEMERVCVEVGYVRCNVTLLLGQSATTAAKKTTGTPYFVPVHHDGRTCEYTEWKQLPRDAQFFDLHPLRRRLTTSGKKRSLETTTENVNKKQCSSLQPSAALLDRLA